MAEKESGARARVQRVKHSAATMPLSKFLKNIDRKSQLSRSDRLLIVEQALLKAQYPKKVAEIIGKH